MNTYYSPYNSKLRQTNFFDFNAVQYSDAQSQIKMTQDHKPYKNTDYLVGAKDIFGRYDDYSQEPVGKVFFSSSNIKRLQRMIRDEIARRTNNKLQLEEDQDVDDLLIAMRAVYQMHGKYIMSNIVHQVKLLNARLVDYVVPDMITEIKQYYGYLKDVNEPIKPIDRPMNVSNAGRRTLPSISTIW